MLDAGYMILYSAFHVSSNDEASFRTPSTLEAGSNKGLQVVNVRWGKGSNKSQVANVRWAKGKQQSFFCG